LERKINEHLEERNGGTQGGRNQQGERKGERKKKERNV